MINHGDNEIKKTCLETDFGIDINNHIFLLISKYSPLALIVFVILNTFDLLSKIIDCFNVETFSSLFFKDNNSEINEGYEYLMDINKKNNGRLLVDSISSKLIQN